MGLKGLMLANGVGIIDPDYRGEIKACVFNRNTTPITIEHGMKITQAVFVPYVNVVVADKPVTETARGEGGFGSTGA